MALSVAASPQMCHHDHGASIGEVFAYAAVAH
jgi:hypothetical protein